MAFEDFVPISATEALITSGRKITTLTSIERVPYTVDRYGLVSLGDPLEVMAHGRHLRLGGIFEDRLVYSDEFHVVGAFVQSDGAHQPCLYEGSVYYTDEWPFVRIHKDGERYLDHFGPMIQVGNPCWHEGVMYFECRSTAEPDRPDAWQVWKQQGGRYPEYVCDGANPAVFRDRLFVARWNSRGGFDYYARPL